MPNSSPMKSSRCGARSTSRSDSALRSSASGSARAAIRRSCNGTSPRSEMRDKGAVEAHRPSRSYKIGKAEPVLQGEFGHGRLLREWGDRSHPANRRDFSRGGRAGAGSIDWDARQQIKAGRQTAYLAQISSGKPVEIRQCSRMPRPRSGRRRSRAKRSSAPVIACGSRSAPVGRYWIRLSRNPWRVT